MQNNECIVIKDIHPQSSIHYLIIPKKHIIDISGLTIQDTGLINQLLLIPAQLSSHLDGDKSYRLVVNNGAAAGQVVFHLHIHFLAGNDIPVTNASLQ